MVTITSLFVFLSLTYTLPVSINPSVHPFINPLPFNFLPLEQKNKDLFVPQNAVLCKHTGKEGIYCIRFNRSLSTS